MGAFDVAIGAGLSMPIHFNQLNCFILLDTYVGIEFLDAHPNVVLRIVEVFECSTIEQQLQQQQILLDE